MAERSKYLDIGKHADFTRAVEGHFFGNEDPRRLVDTTPIDGSKYGSNTGLPFNTPDSGVNYVPRERAGHKVK